MNPDFRKVALIAASLGLLISLFFALRDDDDDSAAQTTIAQTTTAETTTEAPPPATEQVTTEAPPPTTTQAPETVELNYVIVGGQPQGGIARDSVAQGRNVVITVTSDVADEVHLHGYDLMRRRGPRCAGDDSFYSRCARPVRDRAREQRRSDRRARGSPLSLLAHGIGGVKDLPVPEWLFFWGGAVVLVFSFLALGALWKEPQFDRRAVGRPLPRGLERVLRSTLLHGVVGALSAGPARARLPDRADRRAVLGAEPRADLHLHRLLARPGAAAGAVRQRLARAQPVARDRERRRLALAAAGLGLDAAARLPAAARRLARRGRSRLVRGARAHLRRACKSARARVGGGPLQLRDVVRDGRVRPARMGRARQRLHGLLRAARADRAVRRARRQARPQAAVHGARGR